MEQRANIKFCFKLGKKFTIYTILTDDLSKRKVCARFVLHHLNAPPHKTKKVNEFLIKKQICVIEHPPYSPDLTP